MAPWLLHTIVFIEGFGSLGAEIIALRRLTPHIGSSIVITAPTIAFFLLALALGYAQGARVDHDYLGRASRNFLLAALIAGVGLSGSGVDALFTGSPALMAYLFFMIGVLCPLAWLLGQTVPILTNLMHHSRTGEASGRALYWSTLGSFLGSMSLSLLVMQWLGVSAAILICVSGLLLGTFLLNTKDRLMLAGSVTVLALTAWLSLPRPIAADTAYAEYIVAPVSLPDFNDARALLVNQSTASILDASDPPHYTRYIQYLRHTLLNELGFKERDILVLGAGGFTLSHREPLNHYTFVDIDPLIRPIAEQHFLREAIRGEFIADDARHFVHRTERQFDALVVDVFSAQTSIPSHLVTQEFWAETRRVLKPRGVLLANLILDSQLQSPYTRNLLNTIESVYGRCAVEVLQKSQAMANVEVMCHASSQAQPTRVYRDELNPADTDWFAARH